MAESQIIERNETTTTIRTSGNGQRTVLPNVLPNEVGDQAFAEHWNGLAWSVAALPAPTTPLGADLTSVTCVTSCRLVSLLLWGGRGRDVTQKAFAFPRER